MIKDGRMQAFNKRRMSGMTEKKSAKTASHSQDLSVMEGKGFYNKRSKS